MKRFLSRDGASSSSRVLGVLPCDAVFTWCLMSLPETLAVCIDAGLGSSLR